MTVNSAPSFSTWGKATAKWGVPGHSNGVGLSIALQSDGRIVVSGYGRTYNTSPAYPDELLFRFNADGTLDTTFGGGDGATSVAFGTTEDYGTQLVILPTGRLLVGGWSYDTSSPGSFSAFTLARFLPDGSLDTTFGTGGKVITHVGASNSYAKSIVVQPDGRILAAGASWNGANYDFAVVRYNANGSLDTSFGIGGKVTTPIGTTADTGESVVLQADGKILVAGSTHTDDNNTFNDLAVVRYLSNGSLDTSFGTSGKVVVSFSQADALSQVLVQPDGKILLVGSTGGVGDDSFVLVRLDSSGARDTSFGTSGRVKTLQSFASAGRAILQSDGKILVCGSIFGGGNGTADDFAVLRYTAAGVLDTTFGDGGIVKTDFAIDVDQAFDIAVQPDGKIVVTGSARNARGTETYLAVVRYNADGTLDTTFAASESLGNSTLYNPAGPAVVLNDHVTIYDVELAKTGQYQGATLTLERSGGANTDDVFGASGALGALVEGQSLIYDNFQLGTVTTNSGGRLVLTFGPGAAGQARVEEALRLITYANGSGVMPGTVDIQWTFSDGNTGSQGTGGALSATGHTFVRPAGTGKTGTVGNDSLVGTQNSDSLRGLGGNDTLSGLGNADTLDGGSGRDIATYALSSGAITADLGAGTIAGGDADGDVLIGIEGVIGTAVGDLLTGSAGDNVLSGLDGNDTIDGKGGNDTLSGGVGTDTLTYAGAAAGVRVSLAMATAQATIGSGTEVITGFENLIGSNYSDTLTGGTDANNISGGNGSDLIFGGAGSDTISGGSGNDSISGGAGADSILGGSFDSDTIEGGAGADTLSGNDFGVSSDDAVSYAHSLAGVTVNLVTNVNTGGDAQGDSISRFGVVIGSAFADDITGSSQVFQLIGGAGADTLTGGGSSVSASYGTSAAGVTVNLATNINVGGDAAGDKLLDVGNIVGSAFADKLIGNGQRNSLSGGKGNDTIDGGGDLDQLDGGDGVDTLVYSSETVALGINLQTNSSNVDASIANFENLISGSGNDLLTGTSGANRIDGGIGNDTIDGGDGNDTLIGGADTTGDTVAYDAGAGVKVSLAVTVAQNTIGAGIDVLSGFENLTGSGFNDTLTGSVDDNIIQGGNGDDIVVGGAGADTLDGGGNGAVGDTVSYAASQLGVNVDLGLQGIGAQAHFFNGISGALNGEAADDSLTGFENIVGSAKADKLTGDVGDNVIEGKAGADSLDGGGNGLVGDTLSYAGSALAVTVDLAANTASGGDAAGDTIVNFENVIGGAAADRLTGSASANVLTGGLGADTLTGGTGGDTFAYLSLAEKGDHITDFVSGSDLLQISAAGFQGPGVGNLFSGQVLDGTTFVSAAGAGIPAPTSSAATFLYDQDTGGLYFDADGTGAARAAVLLLTVDGHPTLAAADIRIV